MFGGIFNRGRPPVVGLLLAALATACSSPTEPTPPPAGPALTCPADVAAQSVDGNPVVVTYAAPAAVGGAAPVTVECTPPFGSTFKPGVTAVTCTATDGLARTATCGFSVKVSVPARLRLTRFMAFGDSLTEGKVVLGLGPFFKLGDFPGSYPTVLTSLLTGRYTSQAITMSKQGLGGEQTATGLVRLQGLLTTERPDVLLLMDGANDLSGGDPASVPLAASNVEQMVLSAKAAGATVFLATLPPQRQGLLRAGGYPLVQPYNSRITSIATTRNATLVDVYAALSSDVVSFIGSDGLHATPAGYQKMAETFFERIRATLEIPAINPAATSGPVLGRVITDPPLGPSGAGAPPADRRARRQARRLPH